MLHFASFLKIKYCYELFSLRFVLNRLLKVGFNSYLYSTLSSGFRSELSWDTLYLGGALRQDLEAVHVVLSSLCGIPLVHLFVYFHLAAAGDKVATISGKFQAALLLGVFSFAGGLIERSLAGPARPTNRLRSSRLGKEIRFVTVWKLVIESLAIGHSKVVFSVEILLVVFVGAATTVKFFEAVDFVVADASVAV